MYTNLLEISRGEGGGLRNYFIRKGLWPPNPLPLNFFWIRSLGKEHLKLYKKEGVIIKTPTQFLGFIQKVYARVHPSLP